MQRASPVLYVDQVDHAAAVIADACDYLDRRNRCGVMGATFAATQAAEVAQAVAQTHEHAGALELAHRARYHCEQLEAGGLNLHWHAWQALGFAWDAVDLVRCSGGAPSTMGDAASDAAASAANAAGLPSSGSQAQQLAISQIQQTLGPAVSQQQLAAAISSYTNLPPTMANTLVQAGQTILSGQVPTVDELMPLIAGALALSGVGAPVIAAVAAAIPLVEDLLSALGITSGPSNCAWKVGGTCFQGVIPYGPADPQWTTWAAWIAPYASTLASSTGSLQGNLVADAYPNYWIMAQELPVIDAQIASYLPKVATGAKTSTGLGISTRTMSGVMGAQAVPQAPNQAEMVLLFLRTFYTTWQSNAEQAINGHPSATDAQLLAATVGAWNASHASSSTFTFQPAAVGTLNRVPPSSATNFDDPTYETYVSYILSGWIDGHAEAPLTINTGATIAPTPVKLTPPAAPATTSTAAIVGGTVAVAAAAGAATLSGVFGKGAAAALRALVGL